MPLPCDIEILEEHVQEITSKSYSVCDSQVPIELSPDDLSIIETGNWCSWQPTYNVVTPPGNPIGLDPTHPGTIQITTLIKDYVYDKLKAEFDAYKAQFEGSAAFNYVNQKAYHDEWSAYAGQMNASYAQMNQQIYAQSLEIQTASADWNSALATRISETQAQFQDGLLAATNLYQQSYSTATEAIAQVGATAWLTDPVTGKSVLSGFKATASSNSGSEFAVFADNFYIATGSVSGDGLEITAMHKPFQVVGNTVYIGEVDTSKPQITYLGEYASAPVTTKLSAVYKNTTDGNSYIWNGTSWAVWLVKGATGATGPAGTPGANGTRGSVHITVNGTYSSGSATSSAFQSATGMYDKVIGDWVTFNSSGGATDYYRSSNGSDSWVNAALYVNGNLIATGTVYASALAATAISGQQMLIDSANNPRATGANGGTLGLFNSQNGQNFNALAGVNYNSSSTGNGIQGEHKGSGVGVRGVSQNGIGVNGDTFNGSGEWGVFTAYKCRAASFSPFTGSHIAYTQDTSLQIGQLVYSIDAWTVDVSQTLVHVAKTTTPKDKRVFGVVNYIKHTLMDNIEKDVTLCNKTINEETGEEVFTIKPEYQPYVQYMQDSDFVEVSVNALGEGGILVCSENGDIENGDYLTSANLAGYAMRQDDDMLHSYTVAKALESVDWANESETTKMIACTYHAG